MCGGSERCGSWNVERWRTVGNRLRYCFIFVQYLTDCQAFSHPVPPSLLIAPCELHYPACPETGQVGLRTWAGLPRPHTYAVLSQDLTVSLLTPVFILPTTPASGGETTILSCVAWSGRLLPSGERGPVLWHPSGQHDPKSQEWGQPAIGHKRVMTLLSGRGFAQSPQSQEGATLPSPHPLPRHIWDRSVSLWRFPLLARTE